MKTFYNYSIVNLASFFFQKVTPFLIILSKKKVVLQ